MLKHQLHNELKQNKQKNGTKWQ